jgi:hypothetical protein
MDTQSNKWNGTGLPAINSLIRLVSYGHTEIKSSGNARTLRADFKFGQLYEVIETDYKWNSGDGTLSVMIKNPTSGTLWVVLDDFQSEIPVTAQDPVHQPKVLQRADVVIARSIIGFGCDDINYMERDGVELGKSYTVEDWIPCYSSRPGEGASIKICLNGFDSKWLPAAAFEKYVYTEGTPGWGTSETRTTAPYDPTNLRVAPVKAAAIDQNPKVRITALERINVPIMDLYVAKNIPRNLVSQNRISIF